MIFRDYGHPDRGGLAREFAARARRRKVLFYVAVDRRLAEASGADGLHLPGAALSAGIERPRAMRLSASCHNKEELDLAAAIGADSAFLSPVFATDSHPGGRSLGVDRFRQLAAGAKLAVIALGGVTIRNAAQLRGPNVCGLGAIGAFAPPDGQDPLTTA